VTFRPPAALVDPHDDAPALALLRKYYGTPPFGAGAYGGAQYDLWDSLGTRAANVDRFTPDDLVAVTFLSVNTPGPAAVHLLRDHAQEFNEMLAAVGPDRDLADEAHPLTRDSPAWQLDTMLRSLDKVGPVIASKLLARKRPRLVPIWDSVVSTLTGTQTSQWEPLRLALRADDCALHRRLLRLRGLAGLPEQVSALRVLDVICWMEGKDQKL